MIEKENNKCSRFFVKDIKNEKFKSITSRIKEIVDIKGKRFILWKIIIKRCYTNKYKNDQLW